jgi:hypothetical protein
MNSTLLIRDSQRILKQIDNLSNLSPESSNFVKAIPKPTLKLHLSSKDPKVLLPQITLNDSLR